MEARGRALMRILCLGRIGRFKMTGKREEPVSALEFASKNYVGKYFVDSQDWRVYHVQVLCGAGCEPVVDTFGFGAAGNWHPDEAEVDAVVLKPENPNHPRYFHMERVALAEIAGYRPATREEIKTFKQVEREHCRIPKERAEKRKDPFRELVRRWERR